MRGKPRSDGDFRAALEQAKRESTLQVLFRVSRLLDERALARVGQKRGGVKLRRSHSALFPHIDLEGTRMTELAERMGISKQAVSQLVDDLEALGVLIREPDPDDARAKRVHFTARGRRGLLEGLAELRAFEAELAASIGPRRMEQLRDALLALLGTLEG